MAFLEGAKVSLSPAQNRAYFTLWGKLRKQQPGADRHKLHEALNLPPSHTDWNTKQFGHYKQHVEGITDAELPGDDDAKRGLYVIDYLCAALGVGEEYAEAIVQRMNAHGQLGGQGRTLRTLPGDQLRFVTMSLANECRRHWRDAAALVVEIRAQAEAGQLDEDDMRSKVAAVLKLPAMPELSALGFDRLLLVLATVRRMSAAPF